MKDFLAYGKGREGEYGRGGMYRCHDTKRNWDQQFHTPFPILEHHMLGSSVAPLRTGTDECFVAFPAENQW
eukprot:Gb_37000 [translate_table: standard]